MENKDGDTHVSESQIIAEEVLFELGQSGSANPDWKEPSLTEQQHLVTKTAAFSDSMSTHSQERAELKAKHCAGWSSHLTSTAHTLQKQTHRVLETHICFLACCHVPQNIPVVFKQQAESDVSAYYFWAQFTWPSVWKDWKSFPCSEVVS